MVQEFPKPLPGQGEMLVRVEIAGICGTDIHVWSGKVPWVPTPIILGHESLGRVEDVGSGRETDSVGHPLRLGDHVYWAIGITCGHCFYCMRKTPTRCLNREAIGLTTPCSEPPYLRGGFAEYILLPADTYVFKVPDTVPSEAIAAVGCAGPTMIAGVENVGVDLDDVVAVLGAGPVGLFGLILAQERGARLVIVVGAPSHRLEHARRLGADFILDLEKFPSPDERIREVKTLTGGFGPDVVFDCTGVPTALGEAIGMVRDGGRVLEVGAYADYGPQPINPYHITNRQLKIVGSYSKVPRHEFEFLNFMEKNWKRYPFVEMISHKFPLDRINEAFQLQRGLRGVKVTVVP